MNPPARLLERAFAPLDHAAGSVVPEGGPLIPFAWVERPDGQVHLHRFPGELAEAQDHARTHVRTTPAPAFAAVARDGYLTVEGKRWDAVFVEASSSDDTGSVVLAQRYAPRGLRRRTATVGNPAVVEIREHSILG